MAVGRTEPVDSSRTLKPQDYLKEIRASSPVAGVSHHTVSISSEKTAARSSNRRVHQKNAAIVDEAIATDLFEAVRKLNDTAKIFDRRIRFSVHEATGRIVARVIDARTDEVIREIPPRQILDLVAKLQELLGIVIDEKA